MMLDVLMCIQNEHNLWMVGVAVAVCVIGSLATFFLYAKTPVFPRRRRWAWLGLTGLVAGSSIWTTHFVAMLGFDTTLPTAYGEWQTAASLLAAMVTTTLGFALASAGADDRPTALKSLAGGLVVGLGVSLMHYIGMSGFRTAAQLRWEQATVEASVAIGAVFGALSLYVARPGDGWLRQVAGAALLALAIGGMHFTGMTALWITPDLSVAVPAKFMHETVMASLSVGGCALIVIAAVGGVALDNASRNGNLRRLRQALDVIPDGLAFYDASDKLVAWNAQYEELCLDCGITPVPGMPFSDLLRSSLVHGAYPDARGREVEWLAERKAARRGEIPSLTQRMAGGRWLRVTDRRTVDGGSVSVSVDITELKQAELAMIESRDRAEDLASRAEAAETVAGLGHWRMDARTGVVSWSQQLYRIFGLDVHEPLEFEALMAMTHPEDVKASRRRIQRQREQGDVQGEAIVRIIRPDGQVRALASKSSVERAPDGSIAWVIGTMVDVTDQKTLESKLRHAQAEAETAAKVKADFLANMSHELRTPLTSIIGFTGLAALQPDMTDQTRGYVNRVRDASQALLSTVNDILDFSKLEAGQVAIQPQPCALPQLCRSALGMLAPQAGAKNLRLAYEGETGELVLALDPDRIRQVLLNLVGNAVKFTQQGGVTLRTAYDRAGAMLTVEVVDTGDGIAPDLRDRLFQRFSQIDGSLTRTGGTGLGLAICKGLVEAMGGRIGVDEAPNGGSRFWFSIPAEQTEAPQPEASEPAAPAIRPGLKVLLAEDHPANRLIARLYLGSIGAALSEAVDGLEAVRLASEQAFDVILMDVRMPNLDGPGALERIRAGQGPNTETPVLAFTADAGDARLTARLLTGGFQGVVAKPLESNALVSAIARVTSPDPAAAREEAFAPG